MGTFSSAVNIEIKAKHNLALPFLSLRIKGGLSYIEHNESVFENLEMSGGDLKVDGNLTVSGKISGEVRDLVLADNAEFNANEIAFTKLRNLKIGKNARVYSPNSYSLTVEDNM